MPEDKKPDLQEFLEQLAAQSTAQMEADAALGMFVRQAFGGALLLALRSPDPMDLIYFCARELVGHTINKSEKGVVISCTDFTVNNKPASDWQVIVTPYDKELAEAVAEQQRESGSGTVH
jgi:hypothetical protein